MKVIDIFIKIANNEEVPKKIKFNHKTYIYKPEWKDYASEENMGLFVDVISSSYQITKMLNEEIEVLEEDKEIEERIEKLGEELNKHFQLMVEAKKYFFPEIHEDLLGKEDKEIELLEGTLLEVDEDSNLDTKILSCLANKINELIKAVNELKKGK
jgi:ketopantoate reductase